MLQPSSSNITKLPQLTQFIQTAPGLIHPIKDYLLFSQIQ